MPQAPADIYPVPGLDDWQYHLSEVITGGEDLSTRSELINEEGAITAKNVFFDQDRVVKDTGYKTFGGVVRGAPRIDWQFFKKNGDSELVLVTNATVYKWKASASEWQYVSDGVNTTLTVAAVATDTSITVASITGFSDGDYIGILLDDGTQHQTTINGAPAGSTITLTDAMPGAAAISNAVVKAVDLTGDNSIPVSVTTWAAKDRMYFTNGVDTPRWFDGSTCEIIANLPGTTFTCRIVQVFNDFLQLLQTTEDGTAYPQRLRWANAGFDDQWNASVNFNDFTQTEDWITGAQPLGPYNIIYKERTLIRQSFLGETDKTWDFTPVVDGEGAPSPDAIVSLGDSHIFFGNSNVYEYSGEFDIQPIGDEIYSRVFGKGGDLNAAAVGATYMLYVEELDEIWAFYANNAETVPKVTLRYKLQNQAWSYREWPNNFIGFGFYQSAAGVTWNTITGTWADQVGPWVQKAFLASAPTTHLCDPNNLQVFEYDYVQSQDNGSAISYVFETKDYYNPSHDIRFDQFDFSVFGTNITVEYSTDKGVNWTVLGTLNPGSMYIRQSLWKQFIAPRIRFRFSGSENFGLEWFGMKFKLESRRL